MEPTLGRRLYLAHHAQHDLLDTRMRRFGASLWHWVLLRTAVELDGASQREIAEHIGIEPPSLVPQLDKLAEEGLLERRRDDRDRRVMRVFVTEAGRRRLEELHGVAMKTDAEMRALLTNREADVFGKALERVHEHFTDLKQKEDADGRES